MIRLGFTGGRDACGIGLRVALARRDPDFIPALGNMVFSARRSWRSERVGRRVKGAAQIAKDSGICATL